MAANFTQRIHYNGKTVLAVFVPQHRRDGTYYEVNIAGVPRFYVTWTALDRYDLVNEEGIDIPYELVLAVSDALEKRKSH